MEKNSNKTIEMPAVTEIEKQFHGIRASRAYQKIYALVEDMLDNADFDFDKMLKVCRYCDRLQGSAPEYLNIEDMNRKQLENEFFYCVGNLIKKPYAIEAVISDDGLVWDDRDIVILERHEQFEQCFKRAKEIWENREDYQIDEDNYRKIQKIEVVSTFPCWCTYCSISNHDLTVDEITDVMKLEKEICSKYDRKWFFMLMNYAAETVDSFSETAFEMMPYGFEQELVELTETVLRTKIPRSQKTSD